MAISKPRFWRCGKCKVWNGWFREICRMCGDDRNNRTEEE